MNTRFIADGTDSKPFGVKPAGTTEVLSEYEERILDMLSALGAVVPLTGRPGVYTVVPTVEKIKDLRNHIETCDDQESREHHRRRNSLNIDGYEPTYEESKRYSEHFWGLLFPLMTGVWPVKKQDNVNLKQIAFQADPYDGYFVNMTRSGQDRVQKLLEATISRWTVRASNMATAQGENLSVFDVLSVRLYGDDESSQAAIDLKRVGIGFGAPGSGWFYTTEGYRSIKTGRSGGFGPLGSSSYKSPSGGMVLRVTVR